jgi:hypothetical protein
MKIRIPLSLYRKQVYSAADDQMMPLRKWFAVNVYTKFAGNCNEIRVRYGVVYA